MTPPTELGARYGKKVRATTAKDRVCTAEDCQTVLSRYNLSDRCSLHQDQIPTPAARRPGRG